MLLVEQHDLAGATSSASSKLIHGGLRYLEYYEFRLVAEALAEREVLLSIAPHIIWPLEFVLPHEPHLRPAWMIRLGLFLYDHIGGRTQLPKSRGRYYHTSSDWCAHWEATSSFKLYIMAYHANRKSPATVTRCAMCAELLPCSPTSPC